MAKYIWILVGGLLVASCGAPKKEEATLPPMMDPSKQPAVSQSAEKKAADPAEVKKLLDVEEYPGVEVVESNRLVSDSLSPDEVRFELVRRSKDAPAKVVKYYEDKLSAKATGQPGHQEIFGRTQRGNFVRVHVDAEDTGSKFTLSVISYAK